MLKIKTDEAQALLEERSLVWDESSNCLSAIVEHEHKNVASHRFDFLWYFFFIFSLI